MRTFIQLVLAFALLAFAALALAANGQPVYMKYAGYGHDLSMDSNDDGFAANLTQADGKGTFGRSTIAITVEFEPDQELLGNCPDKYFYAFAVVPENYWAFVTTFPDHSQLFGVFNEGWLCMTENQLEWEGQTNGFYYGGTGRFADASGTWVSTYQGENLDAVTGFRSITGDVTGVLNKD